MRPAHCNRAVTLKAMGRLDEALASLDRAIELKATFPEAISTAGLCWMHSADRGKPKASFDHAVRLNPKLAAMLPAPR